MQRPHHRVQRIGDADHEGIRRVFLDAGANLLHHLEIDVEQIVAAHAGLRGTPAVTMHTSAPSIASYEFVPVNWASKSFDRRGLGDVERLALRDAFHDVEHHDVAELLEPDQVGERAADLAGADQRNLVTRHDGKISWLVSRGARPVVVIRLLAATSHRKSRPISHRRLVYIIPADFARLESRGISGAQLDGAQVSTIFSDMDRGSLPRAVRQAEIGLRAHLDQARRGALEFAMPR